LIATLVNKTLTFKLGAIRNTNVLEITFAGNDKKGAAMVMVNLNKEVDGEIFSYELTYEKTSTKFTAELLMKQPMYLFPLPIKFTATFEKDNRGTFLAYLCFDYSLQFELKGKVKITADGIETDVVINTPMENYEYMSGELIATLVNDTLTFKLGAIHNINELLEVTFNGYLTPDTFTADAKITALSKTVGTEVKLTKKDNNYAAVISVKFPKCIVGFEATFAGNNEKGAAMVMLNVNKEIDGEIFSYDLTYQRTESKFTAEVLMKQPMYLFPLPINFTATFEKDSQGIFHACLCVDYSVKFELKGKAKITEAGIETDVVINTPLDELEHLSAELIATLVNNKLTFKLGAIYKDETRYSTQSKELEITLNGIATQTVQGLDFGLKTPFKGLEVIHAGFKNKNLGLNVDASAEIQWGINKKVIIIFVNKGTNMEVFDGKLTVVTPFENYETTFLEYGVYTVGGHNDLFVRSKWADKVVEWRSS